PSPVPRADPAARGPAAPAKRAAPSEGSAGSTAANSSRVRELPPRRSCRLPSLKPRTASSPPSIGREDHGAAQAPLTWINQCATNRPARNRKGRVWNPPLDGPIPRRLSLPPPLRRVRLVPALGVAGFGFAVC